MEPVGIVQRIVFGPAIVESERLLIQIAEQMEWLYGHVGSVQSALQQRPEILKTICMDSAIHVFHRMVNNLVLVLIFQAPVSVQFVGKHGCSSLDMLSD